MFEAVNLTLSFFFFIEIKMGSSFKKVIFDEHVQAHLIGWREKAKKKRGLRAGSSEGSTTQGSSHAGGVQLANVFRSGAAPGVNQPSQAADGSK